MNFYKNFYRGRIWDNQYWKSAKVSAFIYVDLNSLMKRVDRCKKNPEKLSETNVAEHILSGFSIFMTSLFKCLKNKYDVQRGEDCMKSLVYA